MNNNATDKLGKPVLHDATIHNEDAIIIKMLENSDVNINDQDNYG